MNTPVLIGLNGKKGSGKNTVGEFISDWVEDVVGEETQLQGFADLMKLSLARMFVPDCTLEEALTFVDVIKEVGGVKLDTIFPREIFHRFGVNTFVSGRKLIQRYGTEGHRQLFGDDFWINQLLPLGFADNGDSISDLDYPAWWDKWEDVSFCIVTDVRMVDEAQRIKELGGEVWEIVRPDLKNDGDGHVTEQILPRELVDEQIVNDGSLEDLRRLVNKLMTLTHLPEEIKEYERYQKEQLGESVFYGN